MKDISTYPIYKDSGIKWLGKIPQNWHITPIKSIAKLKSIKNNPELELLSVYLNQGVIRFSDVNEKRTNVTSLDLSNYQLVEVGDFVLNNQQAWRGSVGVSKYTGIVSPAYIILSLSCDINPDFANYYFRNEKTVGQYLVSSKGVGTIQRNLYWPQLKGTYISLPPKDEQTAIVNFLDEKTTKIDQAIDQKEKLIELLKERKQIIIQNAVTKGLDKNVKLKDSGIDWIGEIPEHWTIPKMKFISKFILDGTHGSYPRVDNGYRLLSVRNIIDSVFVFREDDSMVSEKHFKEISSKFLISLGDIQLAIVGATLGKVAIVDDLPEKVVTQRSLCTIRVDSKKCYNKFLFYSIQSSTFQNYLWNNAGFSAQPGVYLNTIQNSFIPLPNEIEQNTIVNYIETQSTKIDKAISLQETQIEKLKEYKATLIDSAVTGKIKVC